MKKIIFLLASLVIFGLSACSDDDVKQNEKKLAELQQAMGDKYWAVESTEVVIDENLVLPEDEAYREGYLPDGAFPITGMRMDQNDVKLFAYANARNVYMDHIIKDYADGKLRFTEATSSYSPMGIESISADRIVITYWYKMIADKENGGGIKKGAYLRAVLKPATEEQAQIFANSIDIQDSYGRPLN